MDDKKASVEASLWVGSKLKTAGGKSNRMREEHLEQCGESLLLSDEENLVQ